MGKNKLFRFEENKSFENLKQPTREELFGQFALKGNWNKDFFEKDQPIILELGCGKGEYTLGLAQRYPEKNFIGIDIKGARIWRGAKTAVELQLKNVGFLRTQIEMLEWAFAPNEIAEIWITFPDPQIKFKRGKHRLTHPLFLEKYKKILQPNGVIHLKTDSEFLHGYTHGIIEASGYQVEISNHDIYHPDTQDIPTYLREINTHYENLFLKEGKKITYIKFKL
ncbi:MAG: tRNA (guanosine(46)-N7)-methyltransferase TrmB [Flavobacteriaceae bacterium]|nr:tRNA (guanosine(46)-N7)-methyltransferase TrmB [Flavobacteriaceae bacterium]